MKCKEIKHDGILLQLFLLFLKKNRTLLRSLYLVIIALFRHENVFVVNKRSLAKAYYTIIFIFRWISYRNLCFLFAENESKNSVIKSCTELFKFQ